MPAGANRPYSSGLRSLPTAATSRKNLRPDPKGEPAGRYPKRLGQLFDLGDVGNRGRRLGHANERVRRFGALAQLQTREPAVLAELKQASGQTSG